MIITPQALRGIYTAFNTVFNKAFEGQHPTYEKVATVVPSTSESETYAWLGDIPGMREWIGEREIQNLSGSAYTIKNKDFELTVGVDRNAVEDDKIGLYNPSIQMLGESAALHPDELVYGLLANGFTEKCYDGKAFFATDHPVGKDKASNKGTAKLSMDAYKTARTSIHDKSDASGFAVGTNVKYAATHQFGEPGRTIRARKKKALRFQAGGKWVTKKQVRITIPARPFLGLSEDDMQEMKATVEEFIQKED